MEKTTTKKKRKRSNPLPIVTEKQVSPVDELRDVTKPERAKQVNVAMTPSELQTVDQLATERKVSRSKLIRELVESQRAKRLCIHLPPDITERQVKAVAQAMANLVQTDTNFKGYKVDYVDGNRLLVEGGDKILNFVAVQQIRKTIASNGGE